MQGKIAPPAICPCARLPRVCGFSWRAPTASSLHFTTGGVYTGWVRVTRGGLGKAFLPGSIFLARVLPLFSVLDLRGGGLRGGRGTTPPASCLAREKYVAPPLLLSFSSPTAADGQLFGFRTIRRASDTFHFCNKGGSPLRRIP